MKKYGVIMAGGGGTRFWPLSRRKTPKQLLKLSGRETMINETIDRLTYTVDKADLFIVTNQSQTAPMMSVTEGRVLPDHILPEPCARNTAACIGYAAVELLKKYGDGIMIVTPSDAHIRDSAAYTRILAEALRAAEERDQLVTIGITPTFAATGYGYIKFDKSEAGAVKRVAQFKEKPDAATAKAYLESGDYAWNSGVFVWKASTILEKFKSLVPDIYADLMKIGEAIGTPVERETIEAVYPTIRRISVDYAIMEPSASCGDVLVVPGEFGWSDVGSWDQLDAMHIPDEAGNILFGDSIAIESNGCTVYSSTKAVTLVGVEGLVVVETPDAVMVCPKERAQDVKLIVEALEKEGRDELL